MQENDPPASFESESETGSGGKDQASAPTNGDDEAVAIHFNLRIRIWLIFLFAIATCFILVFALLAAGTVVGWGAAVPLAVIWVGLAAYFIPSILYYMSGAPALVVAPTGIWMRDMDPELPWAEIEGFIYFVSESPIFGFVESFTVVPKRRPPRPGLFGRMRNASSPPHRLRVRRLEDRGLLAHALRQHTPAEVMNRSSLAGMPE